MEISSDAAELARLFGIERSWVYTHAIELGAVKLGGGAKPRHEFAARTAEDYELALSHHLLPFFKDHRLSEITAQEVDRYKAARVREREESLVERPLSNRTINKTLTRLGQILDAAVRYELIEHNCSPPRSWPGGCASPS